LQWEVAQLDTSNPGDSEEVLALAAEFRQTAGQVIAALEQRVPIVSKLRSILEATPLDQLCDVCVSALGVDPADARAVLNSVDLAERFQISLKILARQAVLVNATLFLAGQGQQGRRQLVAKKDETGPAEDGADDEDDTGSYKALRRRVEAAKLPAEALRAAQRELRKLKGMERGQALGPEHHKTVSYLEWLLDLPWSKLTQTHRLPDVAHARRTLDGDHHGLDKIKQRIIEYIAVRWMNPDTNGSILCLVGPPGVGKTSLGRSIASTLGRDFHRISLGGVRDEADIRGFNRTYIGSQPGRIVQGLRRVSTLDPVILLDEIDKVSVGNSVHGDPSSALLEVA
jgi:ATP-dependent Lon protease